MKNRMYKINTCPDAVSNLEGLLAHDVTTSKYQELMYSLGNSLGENLAPQLKSSNSYCVASTAEDADFLSKGLIDNLLGKVSDVKLACFWNHHSTPVEGLPSTAPIIKKFIESGAEKSDSLIVVKSIISGSCVVKTNLTALIESMQPKTIFVVAPVIHKDAERKLKLEFPDEISAKFIFEYFAKDEIRDSSTNEVVPGIGGNVYEHLGFASQEIKNKYTPKIVTERLFA